MATVQVSKLKLGDRIISDVFTQKGNVLFQKGKTITPREIEILKAFFIQSVSIESKQLQEESQVPENTEKHEVKPETAGFEKEYESMLQLLKKSFNMANGGSLPILEIRSKMQSLLNHINEYNILIFTPPKFVITDYIYHNSIMVALTSYNLSRWHGISQKDWIQAALAGLLHDIGNIKIDPNILNKPSKLTPQEFEEIKKHTILGYNVLKNVAGINEGVKLAALQHHEKEDGSGYPLGVKGDKVHFYAKIVAIADVFHAMTNRRFYKQASSPYLVLEQIFNESFGKLDPSLVQTFINKITQFHSGTLVRLSNNLIGKIVFTDRAHPTRPWVDVNGKIINLATDRNLYIEQIVQQ
ncbi:HD-GYP domain-containing protein [Ferviditalea candida]|uniref:HD-GYP domain-containing protein n=1 Tax=Ferviditalea candida TaxID=3108399 RepID=A0ABU5ZM37_9BACL|nr:HD-GYP domain-containing protein [Paenibacillaceae bacterium T2]